MCACLRFNVEIVHDIAESDAGLADGHVAHENDFNLGVGAGVGAGGWGQMRAKEEGDCVQRGTSLDTDDSKTLFLCDDAEAISFCSNVSQARVLFRRRQIK